MKNLNRFYRYILLVCILFPISILNAQLANVEITEFKGKRDLVIVIIDKDSSMKYSVDCFAEPVTRLSDSTKIGLMKTLLKYEFDTSICFWPVRKLHIMSNQLKMPQSEFYRVQVEALLFINLLALGSDVFSYSPFPVLQLTSSELEIANDQKKISKVYSLYRKWIGKLKYSASNCFSHPPLEILGIKWFGMKMSPFKYTELGQWSHKFDCISIE